MKLRLAVIALVASTTTAIPSYDGDVKVNYCGPQQVFMSQDSGGTDLRPFKQLRREINDAVEGDEKLGLPPNKGEIRNILRSNLTKLKLQGKVKKYNASIFDEEDRRAGKNAFYIPIITDKSVVIITYGKVPCGVRPVV